MLCKQQRRGIFNGLYNSFSSLGCLFGMIPCGLGLISFLGLFLFAPAMTFFQNQFLVGKPILVIKELLMFLKHF